MGGDGGRAGGQPPDPALTTRGRALLLAAALLLLAARLLGAVELAGLAAGALVAVGLAMVRMRGQAVTYDVARRLEPARVEVGSPALARLRFTNRSGRAARHLTTAVDTFTTASGDGGRGAAGCIVPPLGPGEVAEATYDLPTARRGVVTAGPLRLCAADPLGLAEVTTETAAGARLIVHPRIEAVLAVPGSAHTEARLGSQHASRVPAGLDFFTLREYEAGDDVRRVHWRSTARMGELMLREDELPWESLATVVCDTRAAAHSPDSFERALEVAASVAAAVVRDGRRIRFVTTGGFELEAVGTARLTMLLDHLAAAVPDPHDHFARVLDTVRRRPVGPVVVVVGAIRPEEWAALGAVRPRSGVVMVADCSAGRGAAPSARPTPSTSPAPVSGAVVVRVPPGTPLAPAWNQAVLSCGRPAAARR
ncbi:MAG: DUF58 domain-containing protein [Acidimicrobiia bacterium]